MVPISYEIIKTIVAYDSWQIDDAGKFTESPINLRVEITLSLHESTTENPISFISSKAMRL